MYHRFINYQSFLSILPGDTTDTGDAVTVGGSSGKYFAFFAYFYKITFHLVKRKLILILCFEGSVVTYEQQTLKHCNSNKYGPAYSTLSLAQAACSSDSNCRGVYNVYCKNSGSFYLCPTSADLQKSRSSCVYEKKEG